MNLQLIILKGKSYLLFASICVILLKRQHFRNGEQSSCAKVRKQEQEVAMPMKQQQNKFLW